MKEMPKGSHYNINKYNWSKYMMVGPKNPNGRHAINLKNDTN